MSSDEVGVEMGQEDMLDRVAKFVRVLDVLPDVALRIDDNSCFGFFVSNEIRRVSQTIEVVLLEEHGWILG